MGDCKKKKKSKKCSDYVKGVFQTKGVWFWRKNGNNEKNVRVKREVKNYPFIASFNIV